jgi:hypothetical protein
MRVQRATHRVHVRAVVSMTDYLTYEELKAKKIECLAPLKKIKGPNGAIVGVVCFKDPDGTILELISGM